MNAWPRPNRYQSGFSLIELMIALVIGLVVIAAVALLALNASRSHRSLNLASQQQESGRFALSLLKEDLEHAGFYGSIAPNKLALPGADPDASGGGPCDLSPQTHINNLLIPVRGYTAAPPTCTLADLKANTNVLVIRRADTNVTACASLAAGNTYIQTVPEDGAIGWCSSTPTLSASPPACGSCTTYTTKATSPTAFSLTRPESYAALADIRRYHVHIYYIRTWASIAGDGIPTLVRVSLTYTRSGGCDPNNTTSTPASPPCMTSPAEPLVEGIDNMQLQFGLDAAYTTPCPYSSLPSACEGSPALYATATEITDSGAWTDWTNVISARIHLLVRGSGADSDYSENKTMDQSYTDAKTYTLGAVTVGPLNDHVPRHVFSQTVRIHNPSNWRDRE